MTDAGCSHITLGYLVPEFPGQTHIWNWREIVALRAQGVTVRLISTKRPAMEECRHAFAAEARRTTHYLFPPAVLPSIALARRPRSATRALRYVATLNQGGGQEKLRALGLLACAADLREWAYREEVNHIHGHSCADVAHILALSKALGGPTYSLTLHGQLSVYGQNHAAKMREASFVTTAGAHLLTELTQYAGLPNGKGFSLPMGVDTDRFHDAEMRNSRPNALRLLSVARLDHCKGHVFAFQAIRRLINAGLEIEYLLAGSGPHREQIEAEVTRLALNNHVSFLGTLGEDQILELMQKADAFLLTSVGMGEASPVAIMEAMSTGCPVVCSIIGSTSDMIHDGRTGLLVEQGDAIAIERALLKLAQDLAFRSEIGTAARRFAVENFDSRKQAQRLLAAIKKSIGEGPVKLHHDA